MRCASAICWETSSTKTLGVGSGTADGVTPGIRSLVDTGAGMAVVAADGMYGAAPGRLTAIGFARTCEIVA